MYTNVGVVLSKISLILLFDFRPFDNVTIIWLALDTLIAQLFMTVAVKTMETRMEKELIDLLGLIS